PLAQHATARRRLRVPASVSTKIAPSGGHGASDSTCMNPHPTSHIPHPTSHIPHPTSHIPHPTSQGRAEVIVCQPLTVKHGAGIQANEAPQTEPTMMARP